MGCATSQDLMNKNSVSSKEEKRIFYDRFREPDIIIPESEKAIIKAQWPLLSKDVKGNGSAVFMKIFKQYPEIKNLFRCNGVDDMQLPENAEFKAHAIRFMQAVGTAVDSIDDLDTSMSRTLLSLGKQHVNFTGFKPIYFEAFYDAISTVWKDVLGSDYTVQSADAWSHVLVFIMETLKKGYHLASLEAVTANVLAKVSETESQFYSRKANLE